MTWQSVGTHTFVPTDKAVQVGSFDLAAGQDTIWVRITQLNPVDDWPWSYGILSWQNANGTPLGSVKAYSNRLGEVFRLGNGLSPSDGVGSIWFEPRGFNLGWLKAGFPWELSFEAQAGASDLTSGYWNRDPNSGVITPKTSGDNLDMTPGWIRASNLVITDGTGATDDRDVPGYQKGTWTPSVSSGTVAADPDDCYWSRTQFSVTVRGQLYNFSDFSSATGIVVGNLPYPITDRTCGGSCMWNRADRGATAVYFQPDLQGIQFFSSSQSKTLPWDLMDHSDLTDAARVHFSGSFLTNDTTWQPANGAVVT